MVRRSVAAGARLLLGGKRLDGPGNFYAPTVLGDVPPGSPAAVEEIFGPVASLFRVAGLDEAIAVANQTRFGLGASAWTGDDAERARLVREIEAGAVFINGMVKSDPQASLRGSQAVRLRPGAGPPGHPRVRQRQERLGGVKRPVIPTDAVAPCHPDERSDAGWLPQPHCDSKGIPRCARDDTKRVRIRRDGPPPCHREERSDAGSP